MVENMNNEQINKNIKTDQRFDFLIFFYVFGLVCLVVDFLKVQFKFTKGAFNYYNISIFCQIVDPPHLSGLFI